MAKTQAIGRRVLRPDAVDKVTGRARFPGDLTMDKVLAVKVLFSTQAHARIVSIDTSQAESLPGVVAVLTHKDVPVNEYGLIYKDQPALNGDKVRSVFDRVALVVAETQQIARQARDLIKVEYEPLPVLTDPREAMKPGAVTIQEEWPDNIQ
ncbi:MAG: aldehyde oxidase, partial [Anaerolineae bacterium]